MKTKRLVAFFIDYAILLLVMIPIVFMVNFDSFFYPTEENFKRPFETAYPIIYIALFIFFNKDLFGGKSIGRRITGIEVREYSDLHKVPGIIRLFLRNLTMILWPIEVIVLLATGRRLGDRLARTRVVEVSKHFKVKKGEAA